MEQPHKHCRRTSLLAGALIGVGTLFRISQYLYNRSLTEGEAPLAMNVIKRSFLELIRPLDYSQTAPVGFLWIERSMVLLFGTSEYSLRLFPLLAGITALFLFWRFCRRALPDGGWLVSLALFCCGDHVIYFSSEVKQYSSDVLTVICVMLVAWQLLAKPESRRWWLVLCLCGVAVPWFSHPGTFALAAVLGVLVWLGFRRRLSLRRTLAMGALWLASCVICYLLILRHQMSNTELAMTWSRAFMPIIPRSRSELLWYPIAFLKMLKNPLGLSVYELLFAVLALGIGTVQMIRARTAQTLMLLLPVAAALVASALHLYPFEGRLLLFLVPLMLVLIGAGVNRLYRAAAPNSRTIAAALALLLVVHPAALATYRLVQPRAPEEIRPLMQYLARNVRPEDTVYLYYAAHNAYDYYADRYDLDIPYVLGSEARGDWSRYYRELESFRGTGRFWILFSHVYRDASGDEEQVFSSYLDALGIRKDVQRSPGAALYRYDLSY